MFKSLAELAMRGRLWAIAIALLGSGLPLISQATFGVVTLRKGWREGLLVVLWASLPALVGLWVADFSTPMAAAALAIYAVSFAGNCVLRFSVSWPLTLVASVALTTLSALVIMVASDGFVVQISTFFEKLLTPKEGRISDEVQAFISSWNVVSASGLIAYWISIGSLSGMLVGRWWQALLYNPGGFQREMHELRLPVSMAVSSAAAWVFMLARGEQYEFWANVFALPLIISGLGVVHWLVARFKIGLPALVTLYVLLPLVSVIAIILILLALFDSGLDLRQKFKNDQSPGD